MKNFRFYREYDQYRWRKHAQPTGNVVALYVPEVAEGRLLLGKTRKCARAINVFKPNSQCHWSIALMAYISRLCKRVNEAEARKIHPALFEFLEKHPR
jgi:hypothetical protein